MVDVCRDAVYMGGHDRGVSGELCVRGEKVSRTDFSTRDFGMLGNETDAFAFLCRMVHRPIDY